jgi:hypothetical protein
MSRRKRPGDFGAAGLSGAAGYGNSYESAVLPVAAAIPAPTRPFNVSSLAGALTTAFSPRPARPNLMPSNFFRRMGSEYSHVSVHEQPSGGVGEFVVTVQPLRLGFAPFTSFRM